jgi:hypothetical protein
VRGVQDEHPVEYFVVVQSADSDSGVSRAGCGPWAEPKAGSCLFPQGSANHVEFAKVLRGEQNLRGGTRAGLVGHTGRSPKSPEVDKMPW